MTASNIEVSTAQVLILDELMLQKPIQQLDWFAAAILYWRRDQLWVKSAPTHPTNPLPAFYDDEWLKQCLHHSPIWAVCLDPNLHEATLKHWVNACEQVKKPVFLRWFSTVELPQRRSPFHWMLKRGLDWLVAACVLLLLSPLLLLLVGYVQYYLGEPVFSQEWCVGYRGELFRTITFRTASKDGLSLTPIELWMKTYHLDQLPQLFNVLRGKMSLVGPRLWTLSDPERASSEARKRLNALPGMITRRTKRQSACLALEAVNQSDLQYLSNWSLVEDFKILLTETFQD